MPTIAANQNQTFSLPAGFTITVTSSGSGSVYSLDTHQLLGTVTSGGASLVIGPYSDTRSFLAVAVTGALTYGEPTLSVAGGGGATAFTDLTDCPATIIPNALLVGNAAGDGVVQADGSTLSLGVQLIGGGDDEQANGGGSVTIRSGSDAYGGGAGNVTIEGGEDLGAGGGAGNVIIRGGRSTTFNGGYINITAGASELFDGPNGANLELRGGGGGGGTSFGGDLVLRGGLSGGNVLMTTLPTSNPAVANALWNDAGTLKISAG